MLLYVNNEIPLYIILLKHNIFSFHKQYILNTEQTIKHIIQFGFLQCDTPKITSQTNDNCSERVVTTHPLSNVR